MEQLKFEWDENKFWSFAIVIVYLIRLSGLYLPEKQQKQKPVSITSIREVLV